MSWTHTEPSPTADATRLTLPDLTSACLEQIRSPGERPSCFFELGGVEIGAGLDEVLVVERHASFEPARVRVGARHQEQVADRPRLRPSGVELAPSDPLEAAGPLERVDLRARSQHDVRAVFDSLNEVARHAVREPRASYQHVNFGRALREKNRRLSGRVSASDDGDLLSFAELRLDVGRAVHDPGALEARELRQGRFPVPRATGDDHGSRWHGLAGREPYRVGLRRAVEADGAAGDGHISA